MTYDDTPKYYETNAGSDPDVIRDDIERTRGDLSRNVNALGEAIRPSSVARRQANRVAGAASGLKERVMGSAEDMRDSAKGGVAQVSDTASQMGSTVTEAASSRTRGNPLAVGLIAFGTGWLAGSVLPASRSEQRLAERAKEQAQPLVEQGQQVAKESAQNLQEPVRQAAEEVKSSAQDAVSSVKDQTKEAGQDVRSSATSSTRSRSDQP
jgi:predicted ATP-dependent serine protease